MSKTIYTVATGLALALSISVSSVSAQNSFSSPSVKSTPGIERTHSGIRTFSAKQSRTHKKAKPKVPTSMDLFVDRCTEAGGGLISIDGHYDCVKPSGEPIPNW